MQRKLKDLNAPQNAVGAQAQTAARLSQMGVSGINAPAQAAQERASLQYRKNLDTYIKDEYKKQEDLVKLMGIKERGLQRLAKAQSNATDNVEKELKIREKIAKVEENQARHRQEYAQRDQAINQAADIKEKQDQGPPSRMSHVLSTIGSPAGIAAGVAAFAGAIKIVQHLAGYGQRLEEARGNAIEGVIGKDLSAAYAGRSPFDAAWMDERATAQGLAGKKAGWNKWTDRAQGWVGTALVAGGIGATVLSGGTMGVPGMMAAGLGSALLTSDRSRTSVFSPEEHAQLLAAEETKDFWGNLENFTNQDQKKKLTMEHYEQNFMRDLQAQRTLGLTDNGFYEEGGLLKRGKQAGFTRELTVDMAQSIVGAGGSARMGNEAQFGLQMQRAGLTNASQVLGTLSGSLQAPGASTNAVVTVLAEAFKRSLNTSDYVEETRRFTAAVTDVIAKTGAVSPESQARIADTFGMFYGERTNAGVQSARNAYEEFQQRSSEVGGRRGTMRWAEAMQDENLSRLSQADLADFLSSKSNTLSSDPTRLEYFKQMGKFSSREAVMAKHSEGSKNARFLSPIVRAKAMEHAKTIADYMTLTGLSNTEIGELAHADKLPSNIMGAIGGIGSAMGSEGQTLNFQDTISNMGELLSYAGIPKKQLDRGAAEKALSGSTDRIGDKFVESIANSADLVRANFNELKNVLIKAADSAGKLSDSAGSASSAQRGASESHRVGLPSGDPLQGGARASMQGQGISSPSRGLKGSSER